MASPNLSCRLKWAKKKGVYTTMRGALLGCWFQKSSYTTNGRSMKDEAAATSTNACAKISIARDRCMTSESLRLWQRGTTTFIKSWLTLWPKAILPSSGQAIPVQLWQLLKARRINWWDKGYGAPCPFYFALGHETESVAANAF